MTRRLDDSAQASPATVDGRIRAAGSDRDVLVPDGVDVTGAVGSGDGTSATASSGAPDDHQLGLALEAAEMGTWRWELRGNIVSWDRRMEMIFGLDEGEFDGQFESFASRLHPDDREATLAQVQRAVENDTSYRVVHRVIWPDGSQHWVDSVGSPLHSGDEVTGMIGITVDVTQRKAIEDAVNQLAAIVESTSDAIYGKSLTGRITSWNPGAEHLFGYTAEEAVGRPVTMLCPPGLEDELFEALAQIATGATIPHRETVRARKDGTLVDVALSMSPVRGPGLEVIGASVIARDITAMKQQEAAAKLRAERLERLDELTTVLASAEEPDEVLDAVIGHVHAAAEADAGLIALVSDDGSALEVVRAVDYPADIIDAWRTVPIMSELPIAEAFRSGVPLFQTVEQVSQDFPDAIEVLRPTTRGVAVLPLQIENRRLGVLGLSFVDSMIFDEDQRDILVDLANRCAVALGRSMSFMREMAARARAEVVSERLAFLAEAGGALATSLDVATTAETVASLAVPRLADWCAVTITGPDGAIVANHPDPELADAVMKLTAVTLQAPAHVRPGWEDVTARRAVLWANVDPSQLAANFDDEHRAMIERLNVRSMIIVPLASRERTVGALTLARSDATNPYSPEDLVLAEELARRAATAIENARLFGEQHHIARTLQDNLLPRELPVIPGLDLGARYNAAGRGTEVGGDFYDAFELANGQWALVIGDVCGQGAEAAGVTALARHTLRAIATIDQTPSEILHRLNDLLLSQDIGRRFITVALAIVHVDEDGVALTIAQGGHPDPIVCRADGSVQLISESRGTVLGVLPNPSLRSASVRLGEGDTLVLYTDGVTEVRHEGEQFGVERLCEVVSSSADTDADALAQRIVEASIAFSRADITPDDIAVFTARCRSAQRRG